MLQKISSMVPHVFMQTEICCCVGWVTQGHDHSRPLSGSASIFSELEDHIVYITVTTLPRCCLSWCLAHCESM